MPNASLQQRLKAGA